MIYWEDLPEEWQLKLKKLEALEEHGVDNWEGYGDAMRSLYSEEDEE